MIAKGHALNRAKRAILDVVSISISRRRTVTIHLMQSSIIIVSVTDPATPLVTNPRQFIRQIVAVAECIAADAGERCRPSIE